MSEPTPSISFPLRAGAKFLMALPYASLRCLVLNASMEPISVVSAQRGLVLLLKERAMMLERAQVSATPVFPLPPGWQMKPPIKTPCRRNLRPIPPGRRNLTQGMQPKTPAQAGRRESDEPVFLRSERCKWEAPSVIV